MKNCLVTILLLLWACSWAEAESSVWRARKEGVVIYLGGTCHILRESDFPLPPEFEQAYQASQIVAFETDLGKLQDPAVQQRLLAKNTYDDGSTIDKHLSAKTFAALNAYAAANGIPLQALQRFKPSLLMMTLTLMELMKLGVSRQGVDTAFYTRVITDRKKLEEFETIDRQIDYIVSMADGNEDAFVEYTIKDMKNLKEQFRRIIDAWRRGDEGKLDELLTRELRTSQPQIYSKLIVERNKTWLPIIDVFQNTPQTRFVLVGVAHLIGPDGLIAALRKKGYEVDKL